VFIIDNQRNRPRPAAPRQPARQRRQIGHVIGRFFRAFDRQGHRRAAGPTLHPEQSLHSIRAASTGRQSIHGFGRQGDQLPFRQRLNRTMNDVATVFGITNINDGGRHKHRKRVGHEASITVAKRAGFVGRYPQRRIINYIARPTDRSSAKAHSGVA
jgi:hypothetical protein